MQESRSTASPKRDNLTPYGRMMTDLLEKRSDTAIKKHPNIQNHFNLLLSIGGKRVAWYDDQEPRLNQKFGWYLHKSKRWDLPVILKPMEGGACHDNVGKLWEKKKVDKWIMGFVLSNDGIWREHSWGIKNNKIIETTKKRKIYFGGVYKGGFKTD